MNSIIIPGSEHENRDYEQELKAQVEKWRERLLDLGNRNPLINCSFNPSRGVLEVVHPECETVWRKLAADSEAGVAPMRFPWRRDLVPPPPKEEVDSDLPEGPQDHVVEGLSSRSVAKKVETSVSNSHTEESVSETSKNKEWNPDLEECLRSNRLKDDDLITTVTDNALNRRLRTLDGHAHLSLSEQGVHCLYVVFGFLKWYESVDSDKEILSPLMLVPVMLSRASVDAPWELIEAEDDVIDNLCLRQRLRQDFSLELPDLPDIDSMEDRGARTAFLDEVTKSVQANSRWRVEDRCALGRFAFPKIAMWKDLGDHSESIVSNPLCRTIGGDSSVSPTQAFGVTESLPNAAELDDSVPPGEIKAILDCDSSQLEAIVAARKGVSFVLDGPPGTGKSQTIANIIADALATGKRVLFVSEKMAALEVVKRRLDERGLGDFCLECHSSKANRKAVLEELRWCLELPAEVYDDIGLKLNEARQKRDSLNNYVRSLHRPRYPFGLSPYQICGHVTRLTRAGFANRSRCQLPNPLSVDRSTFDNWLSVLSRASEVAEVITRHNCHPWRGCKLTARSLTLADDIQFHFKTLSDCLDTIEKSNRSLLTRGLLQHLPTTSSLHETLNLLCTSVEIPQTPASWFNEPREVAETVLERVEAHTAIHHIQDHLTGYVEGITTVYRRELVSELLDENKCEWSSRLANPLPNSIRGQHQVVTNLSNDLATIAECAEKTETAIGKLIEELAVPISPKIRVATTLHIIELGKVVEKSYPLEPGWLDSKNWSELRLLHEDASAKLDSLDTLRSRFESRMRVDQAGSMLAAIASLDAPGAWANVARLTPEGTPEELQALDSLACKTSEHLKGMIEAVRDLSTLLSLSEEFIPTRQSAIALLDVTEGISTSGEVHGAWVDPNTRKRIRTEAKNAIEELNEAKGLRDRLEERLSHRAFQGSAAGLVTEATSYSSLLKRLFGRFSLFKREMADFYKSGVPPTKVLLSDCEQLRHYHRRLQSAQEIASKLGSLLPEGLCPEDPDSWRGMLDTIDVFENVTQGSPTVSACLPPIQILFQPAAVEAARKRAKEAISAFSEILQATPLEQDFGPERPLEDCASHITAIVDSTSRCQRAWDFASSAYSSAPADFSALLNDLRDIGQYQAHGSDLRKLFDNESEHMPRGAIPTERSCWERLRSGINAAERLCGFFRDTSKIQDVMCVDGQINTAALEVAVDSTQLAFKELKTAFKKLDNAIELSPPGEPVVEPGRRTLASLSRVAREASEQFGARRAALNEVIGWLRPEVDVPLDRLRNNQGAIEELQKAAVRLEQADEFLKQMDAELPGDLADQGREAATWLLEQLEKGSIPPLLQAVATEPDQRQFAIETLAELNPVIPRFQESWAFLIDVFDVKEQVSRGFTIEEAPLVELANHLRKLCQKTVSLDQWLKFSRWRREMRDLSFESVVEELLDQKYQPHEAIDCISARYYRKLFDQLADEDSSIGDFDVADHERIRERFRQLDEWEVRTAAAGVRQFQLGRKDRPRLGWAAPASSELGILQREIQKKRRHRPLRKLFAEIPGVLQRIKPCVMMSPLSVSTFLQTDDLRFDLVIFDEASQVFPWDAMGAVYRGSQLIVAGDEKQLPPTNFFNRADIEDEDADDDIADYESILSVCKSIGMPSKRLRWHYRSRREPLIVFSNHHFYAGELVTFPSVRDVSADAVRLEFVPDGVWTNRKNLQEAKRIAELVIEHLRTRPDTSLGIIAFSATQQHAIEDAIYDSRRLSPEVDALFNGGFDEPIFIKNLENVQGDERDMIFLSMGYAYSESGKFLKNFGPLTKAGGERRLNVAVTRAREEVVLIASVRASDMDLSNSRSEGAHLLKAYLAYAEHGVESLATAVDSMVGDHESPFEEEVSAALAKKGLHPVAQVGCGGFRIDLALRHPDRPGEFCLGIECDGATYHSSSTARDRDRIRQSVLEGLGWRLVRIWSTDWVRDPNRQIDRVLEAYEDSASSQSRHAAQDISSENGECDLQPRIIESQRPQGRTYNSIDEVPDGQIRGMAKDIVARAGASDWNDLVKLVARELGFARTGHKIRSKIENVLASELISGSIRRIGDRVAAR